MMLSTTTSSSGNVVVNDDIINSLENSNNNSNANQDQENSDLYDRYLTILNTLPEGWTRNPKSGSVNGEAPYVNVSTGEVSWKHPNQSQLKSFLMQEQENRQVEQEEQMDPIPSMDMDTMDDDVQQYQVRPTFGNVGGAGSSLLSKQEQKMIKKLRLMLQAGAPLEVVERRAAVEKIDMSLVLLQSEHNNQVVDGGSVNNILAEKSSFNNHQSQVMVSPVLLKKYIRMRKMGVGLAQVQQLAYIEAKLTPEQVVELLSVKKKDNNKTKTSPPLPTTTVKAHDQSNNNNNNTTFMDKYRRMHQAGVPFMAIQTTAEKDGITMFQLEKELYGDGTPTLSVEQEEKENTMPSNTNETVINDTVAVASSNNNNNIINNVTPSIVVDKFFTVIGWNKVALEGNTDLAALVRKVAHSVDKMGSSGNSRGSNSSTMVIDTTTLYHALGSLQAVQMARDDYNMTCAGQQQQNNNNDDHNNKKIKKHSIAWIKAKRQAFDEMARGIGMKLPKNFSTMVDIAGLDELLEFLKKRYHNDLYDIQSMLSQGYYDFDSLAVMYQPGTRVVAKNVGGGGVDMICKVAWNRYQQGKTIMGQPTKYFQVCLEYVVAVGANNATIAEVIEGMESFDGKRSLLGGLLQFVPLTAYSAEQQVSLLERYRHRGQIYNEVALNTTTTMTPVDDGMSNPKTYSYKAYQKGSFFVKHGGGAGTLVGGGANPSAALATGGRIIIDSQGAFDYGHSLNIGYDPMITGIKYKLKEYKLHMRDSNNNSNDKTNPKISNGGQDNDDCNGMVLFDRIPDDYLEFVWPCVVGFSLSAKAWGDCLVDGLEDIVFYDDAFDRLVLPESRKRLVKALVKYSAGSSGSGGHHGNNRFQDLIAGKGEGTVFLLYGPPGVGKTLTAEAVAEVLKRPLFSVSMGTLGTTADELEKRLGEILKLSAKWDAIILLDEADSFLETRSSTSSLERNAMVSVMLKLVEYFSGILFLTSNRFDSLDPAFQTRITLALAYENLDVAGREKVWENLLSKSDIDASMIDTKELAQFSLNGREIKNALRLALALATEENCDLTHDILMDTAAMIKPVDKEVTGKGRKRFFSCQWWK